MVDSFLYSFIHSAMIFSCASIDTTNIILFVLRIGARVVRGEIRATSFVRETNTKWHQGVVSPVTYMWGWVTG